MARHSMKTCKDHPAVLHTARRENKFDSHIFCFFNEAVMKCEQIIFVSFFKEKIGFNSTSCNFLSNKSRC